MKISTVLNKIELKKLHKIRYNAMQCTDSSTDKHTAYSTHTAHLLGESEDSRPPLSTSHHITSVTPYQSYHISHITAIENQLHYT